MKDTATLITVQGDKVYINVLDPISVTIWLMHICVKPESLTQRFLFWIEECSKFLHTNGAITIEVRK